MGLAQLLNVEFVHSIGVSVEILNVQYKKKVEEQQGYNLKCPILFYNLLE